MISRVGLNPADTNGRLYAQLQKVRFEINAVEVNGLP